MKNFPYMTAYLNDLFEKEKKGFDFQFIRPLLVVFYFFLRCAVFPIKFLFHRKPWGFEGYLIDWTLGFGMKYLAKRDAVDLMIRHIQIEPIIYRHLLKYHGESGSYTKGRWLNGVDGDFSINRIKDVYWSNMTIGHDQLSYEIGERFDKNIFLENIIKLQCDAPYDHTLYGKKAIDENERHSLQILGATNVAILIVIVITIFADLKTAINALNSFFSDNIVLWCMKHLYKNNPDVLIDLDFFLQEGTNRGHYHSSAFFSDPSRYLYYHIVFDEVVYDLLRHTPPKI